MEGDAGSLVFAHVPIGVGGGRGHGGPELGHNFFGLGFVVVRVVMVVRGRVRASLARPGEQGQDEDRGEAEEVRYEVHVPETQNFILINEALITRHGIILAQKACKKRAYQRSAGTLAASRKQLQKGLVHARAHIHTHTCKQSAYCTLTGLFYYTFFSSLCQNEQRTKFR